MTKETEDALLLRLEIARVGACGCGTKSPDIQHHSLNCRYRLLAEAIERIEDLEKTFELRWLADTRAIVRWRAAAPGRNLTSPDHADLVVWLLEQRDELKRACETKIEQARLAKPRASGDPQAEAYFEGRMDVLQWILEVHAHG